MVGNGINAYNALTGPIGELMAVVHGAVGLTIIVQSTNALIVSKHATAVVTGKAIRSMEK